jgi:hypothetical protein
MPIEVDEQMILDSLRQVPSDRWGEVLRFLNVLSQAEPSIQTAEDLARSDLVGCWSDRDDLGTGHEFARQLRHEAEARRGAADAAGH